MSLLGGAGRRWWVRRFVKCPRCGQRGGITETYEYNAPPRPGWWGHLTDGEMRFTGRWRACLRCAWGETGHEDEAKVKALRALWHRERQAAFDAGEAPSGWAARDWFIDPPDAFPESVRPPTRR